MTPYAVLVTILAYFAAMAIVSWLSGRKKDGQDVFYTGGRKTHWTVVAIAMIGSCMSGVTYVSVPGMVGTSGFGYLQMCIGFFLGYLVIAFVLTPLYFRLDVVSIYQYLEKRFGMGAYRTGAWFFFLSKMLGASVRLFLVCLTLQLLLFDPLGLPFWLNVLCNVGVCLAYTYRSGVKSVIWTDVLKTVCMVVAVTLCVILIGKDLGGIRIHEKVFFFDDVNHPQYFWKQLLGGLFTVVAMTGLDQDMMQRTLSCKDTRDSQKNLVVSSLLQTVVIALFLCLGALLYQFAAAHGIAETGDRLFPAVATSSLLPGIVGVLFVLGLVSSAYGAGGSALTSLTTSFTVDILGKGGDVKVRKAVHIGMAVLMAVTVIVFNALNSTSAIDAVYKLASYTYGPILGLFAFGILTKKAVKDKYVPIVALVAPAICLILQLNSERWFGGYRFSYELLLVNAALTFLGLCLLRKK
ncbi:MAG: sodium:solute symporter [Bacteroidales bacterium]|nr:sodium:solute symporter [Bacteroidales bacterium]